MKNPIGTTTFLFCFFLTAGLCYPHGVEHQILQQGMGIQFTYDDNTPISYSEIKIFSPANSNHPYQEGLTDKYGRFFFLPDQKGEWQAVVNDGMGHGANIKITIDRDFKVQAQDDTHLSRWAKILIGIGIIMGISGIIFYLTANKKLKS